MLLAVTGEMEVILASQFWSEKDNIFVDNTVLLRN